MCPAIFGAIRVLQKNIEPEDAAFECAKHGWTLLDMLAVNEGELLSLFNACFPDPTTGAWMRSLNGITAACAFAQIDPSTGRVTAQFPVGGDFCDGGYYVLCQTGCAMQVDEGLDIGSVSITPTTTTPSTTVTSPTVTVTVTTTVFDK